MLGRFSRNNICVGEKKNKVCHLWSMLLLAAICITFDISGLNHSYADEISNNVQAQAQETTDINKP